MSAIDLLTDDRVLSAFGGGWAPEQYYGELKDGRRFYFRMRHGVARLHINTLEEIAEDKKHLQASPIEGLDDNDFDYPPCINPKFNWEVAQACDDEGKDYAEAFWLGLVEGEKVYSENEGAYLSSEDRINSFKRLLDILLSSS